MATDTALFSTSELSTDDYVVIGLSICFIRTEGEVHEVKVAEPIPSAALEAILKGIPTSYQIVLGTTLGKLFADNQPQFPDSFPPETQFCDDYVERVLSAARTYRSRPEARSLIPVGTLRDDLNFSTERKRVLNSERIVRVEDNVKQHPHTHQVL